MRYEVVLNSQRSNKADTFDTAREASHAAMDLLLALTEGDAWFKMAISRDGAKFSMLVQHHGGVDAIDVEEVE